jgi:hypothetical protein
MKHDQLQAAAYQWAHNTFPQIRGKLFAVLNEVHRKPNESDKAFMIRVQQLKAIGLRKGILDLHLDMPVTETMPGAPYEFDAKIKPDKLKPDQLERIENLKQCGGDGFAFYDLDEFKCIFTNIIRKHYGTAI